jgi:hypothetical protein
MMLQESVAAIMETHGGVKEQHRFLFAEIVVASSHVETGDVARLQGSLIH